MDQKLLLLINRDWTSPELDRVMAVASSWDFWTPVLVVLAVLVAWRAGFRGRAFLITAALVAGISDGAICAPLKKMVGRPRPHEMQGGVRQVDLAGAKPRLLALGKPPRIKVQKTPPVNVSRGRSFPSSHTVNTIAVAVVTALFFPPWGALAFLPALLVAYSRIYTGSHWPSDVAGSLLLGLLLGGGLSWAAARAWVTAGRRWWPGFLSVHPVLFAR